MTPEQRASDAFFDDIDWYLDHSIEDADRYYLTNGEQISWGDLVDRYRDEDDTRGGDAV